MRELAARTAFAPAAAAIAAFAGRAARTLRRIGRRIAPTLRMLVNGWQDRWCIRIPGPDELHAAATLAEALRMAERHNAEVLAFVAAHPLAEHDPPLASLLAVVEPWPHAAAAWRAALLRSAWQRAAGGYADVH